MRQAELLGGSTHGTANGADPSASLIQNIPLQESDIQRPAERHDTRRMVVAILAGKHSHCTPDGVGVHIWRRGATYMARGSYEGHRFGMRLGDTEVEAEATLHEVLVNIRNGAFVRPIEARRRKVRRIVPVRLTLRQLFEEFLAEKRKIRGRETASTYSSRLGPVLNFAESVSARKRWPLAQDVSREFLIELKVFLQKVLTTRNGRPGGKPQHLTPRQIVNILECFRTAMAWASRPDVRKLPAEWLNPLSPDLVGEPLPKDPLRWDPLPVEIRIKLVGFMDRWQLAHFALSLVLPIRPDEATGLLLSDVDFERRTLRIGTRIGGADFTKGRQTFCLPFPKEFGPILRACADGRSEGPLLRSRGAFDSDGDSGIGTFDELCQRLEERLLALPANTVQCDRDRKSEFRKLLRKLGGVSKSSLSREFKRVLDRVGVASGTSLYSLRHSNTKGLKDANVHPLDMAYLTSHTTNGILNVYTPLDPHGGMARYFQTIEPLIRAVASRWAEFDSGDAQCGAA
jgi:integrase